MSDRIKSALNAFRSFLIKHKKLLISLLCVTIVIVMIPVFSVFAVSISVKNSVKDRIITPKEAEALTDIDCILVLGAGVRPDGRPSDMLSDRLDVGILLFKSGVSDRLLMSGDHMSPDYDEVNTMKSYAIDKGVESSKIFMDHAGFSTYESVYRAKEIFCADKIVIVTQEYHLYRALYVAEKLGVEAYGVSADLRSYMGQTKRDVREHLARAKDFVYCIFKFEPTYLGDTIPVSGNGDITNDKEH